MRRKTYVTFALSFLASGCGARGLPPAKLGIEVLQGDQARMVLHQCSRPTPAPAQAMWTPTSNDIGTMERALLPKLRLQHSDVDWSKFPADWGRRYVGIMRNGRRFIYGDYSPHGIGDVCDGGPAFFGAEYDVAAGTFSHMAFNGEA